MKDVNDCIPYINFPSDWYIKIEQVYCNEIIRFTVSKKEFGDMYDEYVSVSLQSYGHGTDKIKKWRWEIEEVLYIARCPIHDVEQLLKTIQFFLDDATDTNFKYDFYERGH